MVRVRIAVAAGQCSPASKGHHQREVDETADIGHLQSLRQAATTPESRPTGVNGARDKAREGTPPWLDQDKTIKNTYKGPDVDVGAKVAWTREDSGDGSQTITKSEAGKRVETKLDFGSIGSADADWAFISTASSVHVTWGMKGDLGGPLGRLMALNGDS